MKVYVYPLKYVDHKPVIDFEATPQQGTLINYSEGTRSYLTETFEYMPMSFKSYTKMSQVDVQCTYAYVKIDNVIEKVLDGQCMIEKYKNQYQVLFQYGITDMAIDEVIDAARRTIDFQNTVCDFKNFYKSLMQER